MHIHNIYIYIYILYIYTHIHVIYIYIVRGSKAKDINEQTNTLGRLRQGASGARTKDRGNTLKIN